MALVPLIVRTQGSELGISSMHRALVGLFAGFQGVQLMGSEELFVSSELRGSLLECGADTACIAARLAPTAAALALVVVLDLEARPVHVGLRLIDLDRGLVVGRATAEAAPDEGAILSELSRQVGALLVQAGVVRLAQVHVDTQPAGAAIAVAGAEGQVLAPGPLRLPAGRHQLLLTARGYEDQTLEVQVEAGAELRLSAALEPSGGVLGEWWFWSLVAGVAVAGAAVALVAAQPARCVCVEAPADPCPPCP